MIAFLSNKWGSFAAKATEVAQRARGALHDYVGNEASSTIGDDVWSQGTIHPLTLTLIEGLDTDTWRHDLSSQIWPMHPGTVWDRSMETLPRSSSNSY